MANTGPVIKEPILDEGIQNWRASKTGGHPKLEGIQNWRASKTGGHPKLEGIQNWRASKTGGHPKLEGIQSGMRGSRFWNPKRETRNRHENKVHPRLERRNKRNQDCNSFGKREATGMDKKGRTL